MEDKFEPLAYRQSVEDRRDQIRDKITTALVKAKRDDTVTLIAVTKYIDPLRARVIAEAGIRDFGENRWQVAKPKIEEALPVTWHFLGPIQRNKVKPIAQHFDSIHSVDRVEIIDLLDRYAGEYAKKLDLFLQVNISQEEQKSGVDPDQVEALAKAILMKEHVKFKGLMLIGTQHADDLQKRHEFNSLYAISKALKQSLSLEHLDLSMGMSDDFPIAIEEGATMVRIGRYLVVEENTSTFKRNGVSLD